MIESGLIKLATVLGLGFILGLEHAFDADHVVAVSTIVSEYKSINKSSKIGAFWGLGHTLTLLLVGFIILTFKLKIPQKLALSLEFAVGIVLVALGINVLYKLYKKKMHMHEHQHGIFKHAHYHSHKDIKHHDHAFKSFFIGMIHGLAGSAALMILILATIDNFYSGIFYILLFGIGSIIGMILISAAIGIPFIITSRFKNMHKITRVLAGTISIFLGSFIIVDIGFTKGLFL